MVQSRKIPGTTEAWETGQLGTDKKHARRASEETTKLVDDALGLQMISIRLPKGIIETYKLLAEYHHVAYQPLMRDALCRFATAGMKEVLASAVVEQKGEVSHASVEAVGSEEFDELDDVKLPKAA